MFFDAFCSSSSLQVSDLKLLVRPAAFNNISSDIYYLAFPNGPLHGKFLVYAVYVADSEMFQAIVFARITYTQFAAEFGNIDAINAIPVILWLSMPILTAIGMYHPFFGRLSFTFLQVYYY